MFKHVHKILTDLIVKWVVEADELLGDVQAADYPKLTKEAVTESGKFAAHVSDSIIKILDEDGVYFKHPAQLAKRLEEEWGDRRAAQQFALTFCADVQTGTMVSRYRERGIKYVEFVAQMDKRTSNQCRCLNSTIFKLGSPEVDNYRPPLHHNCRSRLVPVPKRNDIDESMLFSNRDFSTTLENPKHVEDVFKNIAKFNDKYRVRYSLDNRVLKEYAQKKGVVVGIPNKQLLPSKEKLTDIVAKMKEFNLIAPTAAKKAVEWYTDFDTKNYRSMNKALRENTVLTDEQQRISHDLGMYLQAAPKYSGMSARGLYFDSVADYDSYMEKIFPGEKYISKGFMSSTIELNQLQRFSGDNKNIIMNIKSNKGVYIKQISKTPHNEEVLFDNGIRFKVISIYTDLNSKKPIIELEDL